MIMHNNNKYYKNYNNVSNATVSNHVINVMSNSKTKMFTIIIIYFFINIIIKDINL